MRIWDCFPYAGEADILECRLAELDGITHRWVICESPRTHQGMAKPLTFLDELDRWRPWLDRIIYLTIATEDIDPVVDAPCLAPNPWEGLAAHSWAREKQQREHLGRGLEYAEGDDLVLVGDVDTIPRADALAGFGLPYGPVVCEMRSHYFAVDWELERPALTTVACPRRLVTSTQALSDMRLGLPRVRDGGWHFSWLGGPRAIAAKARACAHAELAGLMTADSYESGWCPWEQAQQEPVDVDDSWPAWVVNGKCPPSWFRPR